MSANKGPLENTTEEFAAMLLAYHLLKRMETLQAAEPAQMELFTEIMPLAMNCKIDGEVFKRISARTQESLEATNDVMKMTHLSMEARQKLAHMRLFGRHKG